MDTMTSSYHQNKRLKQTVSALALAFSVLNPSVGAHANSEAGDHLEDAREQTSANRSLPPHLPETAIIAPQKAAPAKTGLDIFWTELFLHNVYDAAIYSRLMTEKVKNDKNKIATATPQAPKANELSISQIKEGYLNILFTALTYRALANDLYAFHTDPEAFWQGIADKADEVKTAVLSGNLREALDVVDSIFGRTKDQAFAGAHVTHLFLTGLEKIWRDTQDAQLTTDKLKTLNDALGWTMGSIHLAADYVGSANLVMNYGNVTQPLYDAMASGSMWDQMGALLNVAGHSKGFMRLISGVFGNIRGNLLQRYVLDITPNRFVHTITEPMTVIMTYGTLKEATGLKGSIVGASAGSLVSGFLFGSGLGAGVGFSPALGVMVGLADNGEELISYEGIGSMIGAQIGTRTAASLFAWTCTKLAAGGAALGAMTGPAAIVASPAAFIVTGAACMIPATFSGAVVGEGIGNYVATTLRPYAQPWTDWVGHKFTIAFSYMSSTFHYLKEFALEGIKFLWRWGMINHAQAPQRGGIIEYQKPTNSTAIEPALKETRNSLHHHDEL